MAPTSAFLKVPTVPIFLNHFSSLCSATRPLTTLISSPPRSMTSITSSHQMDSRFQNGPNFRIPQSADGAHISEPLFFTLLSNETSHHPHFFPTSIYDLNYVFPSNGHQIPKWPQLPHSSKCRRCPYF